MNNPGETVSAIVVADGKIVYAGSDENALAYPANEKEDLGGRVGLPGFSDTHIHLFMDCQNRDYIALNKARNIDEIVETLRERNDGGEDWLMGSDVSPSNLTENRYPTRYELDRVSVTRPIILFSHCLHIMMVNSKALEISGVTKEKAAGDECLTFYDDGEPDGIMREAAYVKYLAANFAEMSAEPSYRKTIIKKYIHEYARRGFTTLHGISGLAGAPRLEYFDQYYELERKGELPVRVVINSAYFPSELIAQTGFGTDMVKVGAKKIFMDGSLGGRTAAMIEPYSDAPEEKGSMFYTLDEMIALIREAYDNGMEASVHAIGDAAMERIITAAEAIYPRSEEPDPVKRLADAGLRRLRIIHASVIRPGHLERIRRLPVLLDVQPIFINSDGVFVSDRLGPDRDKYYLPLKSFLDAGILMTGGSDAPVDPALPLAGIECAVTRRSLDGFPEEGLVPEEALSVYDAVCLFTKNAAFCSSEENIKGTISAGKYADFILLDRDIFETDPREIHEIRILKTVLGGRTTWEQ
jgi:predicted amidohydrolase YtcJ